MGQLIFDIPVWRAIIITLRRRTSDDGSLPRLSLLLLSSNISGAENGSQTPQSTITSSTISPLPFLCCHRLCLCRHTRSLLSCCRFPSPASHPAVITIVGVIVIIIIKRNKKCLLQCLMCRLLLFLAHSLPVAVAITPPYHTHPLFSLPLPPPA